jgi:hypothetical protein
MEASARASALAHAANCDRCKVKLEQERSLTAGLAALAEQMKSLQAGPDVEAALLAAFQSRVHIAPVAPRTRRWNSWVAVAAAIILLVVGVLALRLRDAVPSGRKPGLSETANKNTPETQTAIKARPGSMTQSKDETTKLASVRKPRRMATSYRAASRLARAREKDTTAKAASAVSVNSEIATDFFPVGYADARSLQDGGQIVRVEVPRSALARFGLPVNMERANERIKADVLVGTDGLARAIRFVH